MPASAREGDTITTGHLCDATSTIDTPPQSKVFSDGILCAISDSPISPHTIKSGDPCVPHSAKTGSGSSKVFVTGTSANRIGDPADGGVITKGSSKVFMA